jgi:hypothetical protein
MDFLVLKLKSGGDPAIATDWILVTIARGVEGEGPAVQQGYTGDGRYKAIPWPAAEASEFELGPPGPPTATPVEAEPEPEGEP